MLLCRMSELFRQCLDSFHKQEVHVVADTSKNNEKSFIYEYLALTLTAQGPAYAFFTSVKITFGGSLSFFSCHLSYHKYRQHSC